jgi:hypothetical protein
MFTFLFLACSNRSKKVTEVTIVEIPPDKVVVDFWKDFSIKFNSKDTVYLRIITLDSIWLWNDKISSNEFLSRYSKGYSSSDFEGILDSNRIEFSEVGCHPSPPIKEAIKQEYTKAFQCDQVLIIQDTAGSLVNGIKFSFLKTTKGYRLFGIEYSSSYWRYDFDGIDTTAVDQ